MLAEGAEETHARVTHVCQPWRSPKVVFACAIVIEDKKKRAGTGTSETNSGNNNNNSNSYSYNSKLRQQVEQTKSEPRGTSWTALPDNPGGGWMSVAGESRYLHAQVQAPPPHARITLRKCQRTPPPIKFIYIIISSFISILNLLLYQATVAKVQNVAAEML